jgi:hypothetical protein
MLHPCPILDFIMTTTTLQMVRKISQSQSSYRTKPDIIIDEIYEDEESLGSESSTNSEKKSDW